MANRATTTERGYGAEHQAERRKVAPTVAAGNAECAEPICLEERDGRTRWIPPDTAWDLAHNRETGLYRGPAHARCNRAEAARWRNRRRTKTRTDLWTL